MKNTKIEITSEGNEVWVDGKLVKEAEPMTMTYTGDPSRWKNGVYRPVDGAHHGWHIIVGPHGWVYAKPASGRIAESYARTNVDWVRVKETV